MNWTKTRRKQINIQGMMAIIMKIAVFLLIAFFQQVSSVPISTTERASIIKQAQQEQEDAACMLREDRTQRAAFYTAVRAKHGFENTFVRSLVSTVFQNASVHCFSQARCPEAAVTWCLNLYHPSKCIEVCWNSQGKIINITEDAALLKLDKYLHVTNDCLSGEGYSCMALQDTPFFVNRGLLTCTAESNSCVDKSFISIRVNYVGLTSAPPKIQLHNASSDLVLGEQNVFLISAEYPTEPIDFVFGLGDGLRTYANGVPIMSIIPQNGPSCEVTAGCQPAGPQFDSTRNERVRFYNYLKTKRGCPVTSRTFYTWLVIDDAKESDALVQYTFRASVYVYDPFPQPTIVANNFTLSLNPVNSGSKPKELEILRNGD